MFSEQRLRAVFQPQKKLEKPGQQHRKDDKEESDAGTPSKKDKPDEEEPAGESGTPSKDKEDKNKEAAPEGPIGFFGQVGECAQAQASFECCACVCVRARSRVRVCLFVYDCARTSDACPGMR